MRICYLNHDLDKGTGAGNFCLALMGAIRKIAPSHQLGVLTSEDALAGGWFRLILNLPRIRAIFKKCDIIHALDGWPYGIIAALAAWGLGKRIIVTAIGTGAVQPLYRKFKRPLMIWAYRQADKVVAVSRNTRAEILRIVPDLKIEVVNHGVDYDKFSIFNFQFSKIQNLKPYILSVGALKKRKGYEYSVRAFAEVSKQFPDLKYVIVGQGPECQNVQFLISNFQLQDRIIIFPKVDESLLISLYQNAELFILLPQDDHKDIEGFGLVFLEAAACGLPVIGTRNTGAEDAVWDRQNGYLVEPKSSDQPAEAMSKVLSSQELKLYFSKKSIEWARSKNWEEAVKNYLRLYD